MAETEIIFGAPGCGKTTYLLNILQKELEEVSPERIAFTSFTRKGAYEALTRAQEKFDYPDDAFKYFRTLHSLCFRELHVTTYDMLSSVDYKRFSKAMNMHFLGYYTEELRHNDDLYLHLYFLKKNNYVMYTKMRDATNQDIRKLKNIAFNYNRYKAAYDKLDFTDLLLRTLEQKIALDVDVAIIDEAQDMTTLQWQVALQLFSKAKKLYIAGDDDQAIYEWSGADVAFFLNIEGKRTILDKSWRLRSELLAFAKKISAMISNRVDKDFEPFKEGGRVIYHNELRRFLFNEEDTYYCLSRNNWFLQRYRSELHSQVKVFEYKHKPSISEKVLFAIEHFDSYINDELNTKDTTKIKHLIRKDVPITKRSKWYDALNLDLDEIFYYRQVIKRKIKVTEPKIVVSTIHGVKGGEADHVLLITDVTKAVYQNIYNLTDSELRCLYVACTRAKKTLNIIYERSKYSYKDVIRRLKG